MTRRRGEVGAASIPLIIFLILFAAAATAVATTSETRSAAPTSSTGGQTSGPSTGSGGPLQLPFIGPDPGDPIEDPSDATVACWMREMQSHNLTYSSSKGWRYTGSDDPFAEPQASGDAHVDQVHVDLWRSALEGFVQQFVPSVRTACNENPSTPTSRPPVTLPPDNDDWAGTYSVTVVANGNPECFDVGPRDGSALSEADVTPLQVVAAGSRGAASFTVQYQGRSDTLTGTVSTALDFTATGTSQTERGSPVPLRLAGRFERAGQQFVIRDARLEQDYDPLCSWDFTAKKQ